MPTSRAKPTSLAHSPTPARGEALAPGLFDALALDEQGGGPARLDLAPGVVLLRARARDTAPERLAEVAQAAAQAPWRHMQTPGGFSMSVAMSNCGALGWVSDRSGYRYSAVDPLTGEPWPALPEGLRALAAQAAAEAGFKGFAPDACLINRYAPGARMSLHQDRNERDFTAPIVSVSLGLPVVFQLGGRARSGPTLRVPLSHGDVLVWGGPARLRYHGVLALKAGEHPLTGACRINLTLRKAG